MVDNREFPDLNEPIDESIVDLNVSGSALDVEFVAVSSGVQISSSSTIPKTPASFTHHHFIDTPGGSFYWIPNVPSSVLPVLGSVFDSVGDCIKMYKKYASEGGFGVRLSCQKRLMSGFVKKKYIVCNREGCPKKLYLNTLDSKKGTKKIRTSNIKITGCQARVVFDIIPGTIMYKLTTFDDIHNHALDRIEYKHLSKSERKLTYPEQLFIVKAANSNLGAVKAHNLYIGLKGSSSLVHGTETEFKNFAAGINCFIGDSDAQMLINRMEDGQKYTGNFSFDYLVQDAELCGVFWADEVAKCNYKEFGDIVSFDATYKTNKYKMVFVPFTAIDNHSKSVTVGSGLLKNETTESYQWLLKAFKKAFVHVPNIIVTDQDGAMRKAIAAEFPDSRHRLCMWHIMQKIPAKIVSRIYDDTDFKSKFNKLVWNMYIGPEEFEHKWKSLMEEFNLINHKWLSKMFSIRESWIPAFFVDSTLCGLMRTTSRSESENSFFSHFTSPGATLVKFMICYDSAMEKQRYKQEKLDHQSIDSFPSLLTPLEIEVHAASVYTRALFVRVQKEIIAGSWLCSIKAKSSDEGCDICIIKEETAIPDIMPNPNKIVKEKDADGAEEEINLYENDTGDYKVLHNRSDDSVVCCCQLFVRCGILCRHIFCVLKNSNIQRIPKQYILRRWTKDLIPPALRTKKNRYGEKNESIGNLVVEATSLVDECCEMLRNDETKLRCFVDKLKALKCDFKVDLPSLPTAKVSDIVQEFMGIKKPNKIKVKNPSIAKTKGREKYRIKGGREKSLEQSKTRKLGCSICGENDHNKRTCPNKEKVSSLYAVGPSSSGVVEGDVV